MEADQAGPSPTPPATRNAVLLVFEEYESSKVKVWLGHGRNARLYSAHVDRFGSEGNAQRSGTLREVYGISTGIKTFRGVGASLPGQAFEL